MTTVQPKPAWVKRTMAALGVSILAPIVCSVMFHRNYQYWQLLALLAAAFWLFVCGFFTAFNPLPVARYFARPNTYELMLRDRHPIFTRVYFAIAGTVMMLIALVVGSFFFVLRKP